MELAKVVLNVGKSLIKKSKSKVAKKLVDATSDSLFSFAKRHPLFTKAGELADDGLALVHMTDFAPKTTQILTDRAIFRGTRNSVHTTVNHAVAKVNHGLADWIDKKFAIIMPFNKTVKANEKGKFIAGTTVDLWTNGALTIPRGAVIVRHSKSVPQGKLRVINAEAIKKFKHLKGVRIIETSEQPHAAVKKVLNKMGYQHIEKPSSRWGGFGSNAANEIEKLIEEMKIWNIFAKKHGIVPALHDATSNAKLEQLLNWLSLTPVLKAVPLQAFKNGKLVVDFKKEILKIISQCKRLSKKTGIPQSFDVDILENGVKEAKSFKDVYNLITKKLNLKSLINPDKTMLWLTQDMVNTFIDEVGSIKLAAIAQHTYLHPSTKNINRFNLAKRIDYEIPLRDSEEFEKTLYALKKSKKQVENMLSEDPLRDKIKVVWG